MSSNKRALVVVNPVLRHPQEHRHSLDGTWEFRLDPEDEGVSESWFDLDTFTSGKGAQKLVIRNFVQTSWLRASRCEDARSL